MKCARRRSGEFGYKLTLYFPWCFWRTRAQGILRIGTREMVFKWGVKRTARTKNKKVLCPGYALIWIKTDVWKVPLGGWIIYFFRKKSSPKEICSWFFFGRHSGEKINRIKEMSLTRNSPLVILLQWFKWKSKLEDSLTESISSTGPVIMITQKWLFWWRVIMEKMTFLWTFLLYLAHEIFSASGKRDSRDLGPLMD